MTKWDHLNSENSICFYHGNCLDGVSAAGFSLPYGVELDDY